MTIGVVVTAAGLGTRFGGDVPKQFLLMEDRIPMVIKSCQAFQGLSMVASGVVTVHESYFEMMTHLLSQYGLLSLFRVVLGGASRRQSVERGVRALGPCDYVMIHDAARPWVSQALILRLLKKISPSHGVIPGLRISDTLKQVEHGLVVSTLDRGSVVRVQTPQLFPKMLLMETYAQFPQLDTTDEAGIFEAAGYPVVVTEGEEGNIKITSPSDL